jgi:hypothetical protein
MEKASAGAYRLDLAAMAPKEKLVLVHAFVGGHSEIFRYLGLGDGHAWANPALLNVSRMSAGLAKLAAVVDTLKVTAAGFTTKTVMLSAYDTTVNVSLAPATGDGNSGVPQGLTGTDVCTTALVGSHMTYDVGPGKAYAEIDSVPFGSLVAGDVVNIYARPTPYLAKFGLRAQGTASQPVIINGVSDADCKKPILNFDGAKTAVGSDSPGNLVFEGYNEGLGGIVIKRGPSTQDPYGVYEPKFITIQGLQVQGARKGAAYTTLAGVASTYGSAGCIWIQQGEDITVRNNIVSDCAFGIFVMAKDEMLSETANRVTLANNRVYGNGVSGSYSEHGFYVQAANPVVEGNYIGAVRSGSTGSSYKSRSSGEIFRNNTVECSALCMDFVQSEEQTNGIAKQPDYGTDYVYGNTVISTGPPVIHYGGDNMGEQDQSAGPTFIPPVPYRKHLRFWNNTFNLTTSTYRDNVFRLSALETEVDAWNNVFNLNFTGAGNLSWVDVAGTLRLGPGNVINGRQPIAQGQNAAVGNYSVTTGASIPNDPLLSQLGP